MAVLGVIGLGRLRACWLLREQAYAPHPNDPELLWLLGDLIMGLQCSERLTARRARFDEEGLVELEGRSGGRFPS